MSYDQIKPLNKHFEKIKKLLNEELNIQNSKYRSNFEGWQKRLNDIEQTLNYEPIQIAMVGSTGAGKSTLLNALLGSQILPVSSMKPCTAVVSSVQFSSSGKYEAFINFLTQQEWDTEIQDIRRLLDTKIGEEESKDLGEWEGIKKATQDKIRAVYGLHDMTPNEHLNFKSLCLPKDILPYMNGAPLKIEEPNETEFKKHLKTYLSGDERYWPLVKSIKIFGPFKSLQNGIVLVDLPGVNDPNEAREQVTRKHVEDASYIWVIFNMNRGVTKDIYTLLRDQKLLRQFLLDGKINTLTFVGTCADNVDIDENMLEEFGLPEDSELIDVVRARNHKVTEQLQIDLQNIADELAQSAGESHEATLKLRQSLTKTKAFTVATRAYIKLSGISRQGKDFGIENIKDTNIPSLLNHLEEICHNRNLQSHAENINKRLNILSAEITNFFRLQCTKLEGKHEKLESQFTQLRERLKDSRAELKTEIDKVQQSAEQAFRQHQEVFKERIKKEIIDLNSGLERRLTDWSQIHWATLRAIVTRNGKYTSSSTNRSYDLNDDIGDLLLGRIPIFWDDFFSHHLEKTFIRLCGDFEKYIEVFLAKFIEGVKLMNIIDKNTLDITMSNADIFRRSLEYQVNETLISISSIIIQIRKELTPSVKNTVQRFMLPAYESAKKESGTGLKQRMLNSLQSYARKSVKDIFSTIERDLTKEINFLNLKFDSKVTELNKYVCKQADQVMHNLNISSTNQETKDVKEELDKMNNLLKKVQAL